MNPELPELLVIGDCAIDEYFLIDSPHTYENPKTGETEICFLHGSKVAVTNFYSRLAGNACHVAIGTAKLGMNASILTQLGNDDAAQRFLQLYKENNVATIFTKINDTKNTNTHAIVVYAKDRTIFSYHEKFSYKFPTQELAQNPPAWIYYTSMPAGFETFQADLVTFLQQHPTTVLAMNPGTIHLKEGVDKLADILSVTGILFVNKEEALKITKTPLEASETIDLKELHQKVNTLGPKLSVITDGKAGASVYTETDFLVKQPPASPTIVDTTGAGDTFAAAFLAAMHYKLPLEKALDWGFKNSVSTLPYIGCLEGQLTKKEMEEMTNV